MTDRRAVLRDWIVRFIWHVATGVLAVAVHYGLMALLLRAGATPLMATCGGFVGGAITRFFTAYFHVFAPSQSVKFAIPRFVITLGAQFILNALLFEGLRTAGLGVWPAQIAATILLTFVNYVVYRLWVFR
jgi:putative flippase GtrA